MTPEQLKRQTLFREVNVRIREINNGFGADFESYQLLCECGEAGCAERVEVPMSVYDEIRADGRRFLVAPGHDQPQRGRVVSQSPTYLIVAQPA